MKLSGLFPLGYPTSDHRVLQRIRFRTLPIPLMLEGTDDRPARPIGRVSHLYVIAAGADTDVEVTATLLGGVDQRFPSPKVAWFLGPDLSGVVAHNDGTTHVFTDCELVAVTLQRTTIWPDRQTPARLDVVTDTARAALTKAPYL